VKKYEEKQENLQEKVKNKIFMSKKVNRRNKIRLKIRSKLSGTSNKPRLSVFRSNIQIYAQLIDDVAGKTIVSYSSVSLSESANKIQQAKSVGIAIAKLALSKGITSCCFDRNGYLYHGRVKSLAEGAREGGLII
jgi:large subunit ribosomal protein L18